MFGLNKNQNDDDIPEWYPNLQESQQRWFAFLEKLENKMEELSTEAIPELKQLLLEDADLYKRAFHNVYSGVSGQLNNIRAKARDTYEEKIIHIYEQINFEISALNKYHNLISDFRSACSDRYHKEFENNYEYWRTQIEKTQQRDFEIEYTKILTEFETQKRKFSCQQCSANLTIDRIFLIETYIPCPYCQTQNTFAPSTLARSLQNIARELAEQRTKHLYETFKTENNKERELYYQHHKLSLSKIHESDKNTLNTITLKMNQLEQERQYVIKNATKLYEIYLRAMYDEWNKITPDLKEHNEKMYQNQLQYK